MQLSNIIVESQEAMSIKYNTMVYELQRLGKKVLMLSLGEAFFDIPLFSFATLPFPQVYHYSNSRGVPELRKKISEFFIKNYDIPINYEKEILITSGSKAAIHFAFMATLNPGDEVLIPEPFWVSYPEQVKMCYGIPINIPYYKSVFDFEDFITPKTRVIVINNPHNPTGYVYSLHELNHLLFLAEKYNLWLFSDEAYSEFVENNDFISPGKIDRDKKHTVIFNSISKNYGISGWRLGYVIANEKLIYNILKINQHLITCPSSILQFYVETYFDEILKITTPQIKLLVNKRKDIAFYMETIGLEVLPGKATFYFFVSISPSQLSSEEFCTKLLYEKFISTVPGIGYGESCGKFIRVSIGAAPIEEIQKGLLEIKNLIEATCFKVRKFNGNVLFIGGGEWQVPLIKYLKDKGHKLYVVDPYLYSPGLQFAFKHIKCDVRDFEEILQCVKDENFDFVISDQSDISVNTVAQLNHYFNLLGNSLNITDKFVNKFKMRQFAESLGLSIPQYSKINNTYELHQFIKNVGLPIILKPADSQSSRGVVKIDQTNICNIDHYVVMGLKYANCGYLIAEEFLEGQEVTVEGFASNYKHRSLAISLKRHFRTGIASELRYPADIPDEIYFEIEKLNDKFVENSGLRFGITHAEYMINIFTGRITLIEIACRGGGTLISSDIVNWVSGVNVYDYLYSNLKGDITDVKIFSIFKRHAILKFFEFPAGIVKSIVGLDELKKIKGILSYNLFFKVGDCLQNADDDRSRQGYYIAFADERSELDAIILKVAETVIVSCN